MNASEFKGIKTSVLDSDFKFDVKVLNEDGFFNVHDIELTRVDDAIVGLGITQVNRELKVLVFSALSDDIVNKVGCESFFNYTDIDEVQSFDYTPEGLEVARLRYKDELIKVISESRH